MSQSKVKIHPHNTSPVAAIEEITPLIAAQYLQKNPLNRKLSDKTVRSYADQMKRNEWRLNGNSICFSRSGRLLDGQHRLSAIIKSSCTESFVVVRNLDESSFDTMDTGKRRGGNDALHIAGFDNATVLAAVVKLIIASRLSSKWDGTMPRSSITNHQIIEHTRKHPDLHGVIDEFKSGSRAMCRRWLTPSLAVFSGYWIGQIDADAGRDFFDRLEFGTDLKAGSPILVLRNRLSTDQTLINHYDRLTSKKKLHLVFRAWNLWRQGKQISKLSWSERSKLEIPR